MPRLAPITGKSDVPAAHHDVVAAVEKVFGNVRGPFSMLLHSPRLADRVLPLVTFFRDESVVDAKLRSIAILTAVREKMSAYPWSAQVRVARTNGVPDSVLDIIRSNGDPASLSEDERDVISFTRQLSRKNRVDQPLFDALNKRHGATWMVELTTVGQYFAMIAGIANAFEITPPPDGDRLPAS
jgi:4-carboxymuconolactone decarboxylase